MLIREAKDISSLSNEALAEKLGLALDSLVRFAVYPPRSKTRAPLWMAQVLENRVANLLGRPAHPVIIECTHNTVLNGPGWPYWVDPRVSDSVKIKWRRDRDLPGAEENDFKLAYGDSWPDYGQLGSSGGFDASMSWCDQPALIQQFAFHWGVLWMRPGKYPFPNGMHEWQEREYLVPMGITAEQFVETMLSEISSSMSEPLSLAAKVAEAVHHGQSHIDGVVLYGMGKTVSQAATRSHDPLFLERFAQYSREAAQMMRNGRWPPPTVHVAAGNLPETVDVPTEPPVTGNQEISCKFK
jgi:hypothetical protein